MVKSSESLMPFSRDQLFVAVYDSCRHRSSATDDASALTQVIIGQIIKDNTSGTIRREDIVRTTMQVLGRFDSTAATIYAAYHPIQA